MRDKQFHALAPAAEAATIVQIVWELFSAVQAVPTSGRWGPKGMRYAGLVRRLQLRGDANLLATVVAVNRTPGPEARRLPNVRDGQNRGRTRIAFWRIVARVSRCA